jgi:alpha-glucosidase (family GH31 glycosyl hydrolase)
LTDVPVDGLWIDMNEPSNFCDGACEDPFSASKSQWRNGSEFNPVKPPYAINNQGQKLPLNSKTLDMDTVQYGATPHYNVHNLYGMANRSVTMLHLNFRLIECMHQQRKMRRE